MLISGHQSGTAVANALNTTRLAWIRPRCVCALLLVLCVGCGSLGYPRVSGERFYRTLASHGPALTSAEYRLLDGSGVRFCALTLKAQSRGFVTNDDMRSAAQKEPDLVAKARAFQRGCAIGIAKGIAEGAGEPSTQQSFTEVNPPADLDEYEEFWTRGLGRGRAYGYHLFQTRIRAHDTNAEGGR